MRGNSKRKPFLRGLTSMSLFAVAGLAALALSPGLLPTFADEGGDPLAFARPDAPVAIAAAQPVAVDLNEAIVLANWEFTQHHNGSAMAENEVFQAFNLTTEATLESAQALFGSSKKKDLSLDVAAANNVLHAFVDVAIGSAQSRNPTLASDAVALLGTYIKLTNDIERGNVYGAFLQSVNAEEIAAKATRDASPFR